MPSKDLTPTICKPVEAQIHGTSGILTDPALIEAWASWIHSKGPWDWYTTNTFREETHPESADKAWRVWIRKLNEHIYGRRFREKGKGVMWVRALERQRRGVCHFHSLIKGPRYQARGKWEVEWNQLAGFARIRPVGLTMGVYSYIAKYVTKGGEIDVFVPRVVDHLWRGEEKLSLVR